MLDGESMAAISNPGSRGRAPAEVRILVVDGEELVRVMGAREISRLGYDVTIACGVGEARSLLARRTFHLVFVNAQLPDGSGFDLLSDIQGSLPAAPAVILTGPGNANDTLQTITRASAAFQSGRATRPPLAEVERRYIRLVLGECSGHRRFAARVLGISERNLYRKLREL